jgi:LysM domain
VIVTVPAGGSLWSLAQAYLGSGTEWLEIYQANPQLIPDPNMVLAGQQLVIPVPQQPARKPAPHALTDTALATLTASALATAATGTPSAAAAFLWPWFLASGVEWKGAVEEMIVSVLSFPPASDGVAGPATLNMITLNRLRRAQFIVAAIRRVSAAMTAARSAGTSVPAALKDAVSRETRYYGQSLQAIWGRTQAAARVDTAAAAYGRLLGWNTVVDDRTSPDCLAADRKNFYADAMPVIGYPGTVHPHCRCWPGQPFPGAVILPSIGKVAMAA